MTWKYIKMEFGRLGWAEFYRSTSISVRRNWKTQCRARVDEANGAVVVMEECSSPTHVHHVAYPYRLIARPSGRFPCLNSLGKHRESSSVSGCGSGPRRCGNPARDTQAGKKRTRVKTERKTKIKSARPAFDRVPAASVRSEPTCASACCLAKS